MAFPLCLSTTLSLFFFVKTKSYWTKSLPYFILTNSTHRLYFHRRSHSEVLERTWMWGWKDTIQSVHLSSFVFNAKIRLNQWIRDIYNQIPPPHPWPTGSDRSSVSSKRNTVPPLHNLLDTDSPLWRLQSGNFNNFSACSDPQPSLRGGGWRISALKHKHPPQEESTTPLPHSH